jgi:hypothetical protein
MVAFAAAVRLSRWLLTRDAATGTDLVALTRRHLDQSAWVDAAINDAHRRVEDAHRAVHLGVDLMRAAAVATDPARGTMLQRRAAQARPSLNDPARWLMHRTVQFRAQPHGVL